MTSESISNLVSFWLFFLLTISSLHYTPQLAEAGRRHHEKHVGRRRLAVDSIPGFISIDCGASQGYTNPNSGIPFISDKDLISTGISQQISSEFDENREYTTLRSFPEGTRNCYVLKPEAGRNNKYLIRASFLYGNYDRKNSTPEFDLYIGVNLWRTVQWQPGDRSITHEVIYVPSIDSIDVCLVNTGTGVPFISILELRKLENSIYMVENNGQPLVRWHRYDVAGSRYSGYPDDTFDRNWETFNFPFSSIIQTSITTITQINEDPYKLPEFMLKSASRALNSTVSLNYDWTPNVVFSLFYFCFHFAEIEKLENGQIREMRIDLNGNNTIAESVKLDYLKRETICSKGLPLIPNQNNRVSVSAIGSSDLPPIVNGLEIYYSVEDLNSTTFFQDVNSMMEIKQQLKVSRNWQGDPCNPRELLWDGLSCSYITNSSRIISLNLRSSKLTGDIPSALSTLTEIEVLDLSDNELQGPIPEFLAQLQHLKILNLTGNKLTGTIPETLLQKSKDGILNMSVDGNPEICLSPPCKKKKIWIPIISSVIPALVILILLGVLVICKRKRIAKAKAKAKEKSIESKDNLKEKWSLKLKNRQYSYLEVEKITDNFRVTIGEGGFGKVYLGALEDQTAVAVKVLSLTSHQGYKEFQAEAQLLMIVHHRNLVSLLGYCDEGDHKALIYEYMANGNLHQHLSDKNTNPLSWIQRLQIAVDAAHGLEYLHNGCKPPIIHRDLKPPNILLDKEMQAKISDFGLSRTFATDTQSIVFTGLAGTPGYLDPDHQTCGNVSKQSDVFSFGVILLELITGHPVITRSSEESFHILTWVKPMIKTGDIEQIIDWKLQGVFNQNSAWKILELAISCTQANAIQRPDMSYVLEELKGCLAIDQEPSTKSFDLSTRFLGESEIAPCLR